MPVSNNIKGDRNIGCLVVFIAFIIIYFVQIYQNQSATYKKENIAQQPTIPQTPSYVLPPISGDAEYLKTFNLKPLPEEYLLAVGDTVITFINRVKVSICLLDYSIELPKNTSYNAYIKIKFKMINLESNSITFNPRTVFYGWNGTGHRYDRAHLLEYDTNCMECSNGSYRIPATKDSITISTSEVITLYWVDRRYNEFSEITGHYFLNTTDLFILTINLPINYGMSTVELKENGWIYKVFEI